MLFSYCQQDLDLEKCFGLLRLVQTSDLCYENFFKHTQSELQGQANFLWPLQSCTGFPKGFAHFLEKVKKTFSFSTPCCPYTNTTEHLHRIESQKHLCQAELQHTNPWSSDTCLRYSTMSLSKVEEHTVYAVHIHIIPHCASSSLRVHRTSRYFIGNIRSDT